MSEKTVCADAAGEDNLVARALAKMVAYSEGNLHDIEHLLKVWGYARTIGVLEHLEEGTQETLELAAIVHDIACPLCRVKYGNTAGTYQEREGMPLARDFYEEFGLSAEQLDRIVYLVGHHHTFTGIDGQDYQILVEADFLVNANESHLSAHAISSFKEKVFRTETGTRLLDKIYGSWVADNSTPDCSPEPQISEPMSKAADSGNRKTEEVE